MSQGFSWTLIGKLVASVSQLNPVGCQAHNLKVKESSLNEAISQPNVDIYHPREMVNMYAYIVYRRIAFIGLVTF